VPSLVVENKSAETIDYLQVDVAIALADGQERTVELKSAYREGVLYPIGPEEGEFEATSRHIKSARRRLRRGQGAQGRAHDSARPPAAECLGSRQP
jgi:hypothetical protein